MLSILSDLIGFQTVSGHTKEVDACFDYIAAFLEDYDLKVLRLTSNGFPSIVASSQASKTPKVLLQAHIDVVPAKPGSFKLTEKNDRLYGRGVYDMKFAAACYLQLVHELKDQLARYDFGIMFTSDEEIGGENGVSYLLDQGYGAEVCLLPDGGNDWHIETTCNAVWIVRITADGQSAHGSRPWEGQNAINELVEGLGEIHNVFGELKPNKNSVTISKIQGGSAMNQVPDRAEAILDMRFINDKEYEQQRTTIQKIVNKRGLQLEKVALVKARSVDVTQPHVASFLAIAQQVRGEPITKTHSFGASDACYFANHGIPTVVIRPTGGCHHGDNEWIDKNSLLQFYEVIKKYITQSTPIES
jgi:succinyl-diaminopimelate desuccinylase